MRKKIYQWFKKYFEYEILVDFEDNYKHGIELLKKSAWEESYKLAKAELEGLVDKSVMEKYSTQNWLVNPNRVFWVSATGVPYLNQEILDRRKAEQLKAEALVFKETMLWDVLHNTLRQKAIEKSVLESTNFEQVLAGKLMVHNIGIIKSIIERCADIDLKKIVDGKTM